MPHPPQEGFAACVGIDWADATHAVCVHAVGDDTREFSRLEHTPEAIHAWAHALQERFAGHPLAVCLERNQGPLVYALRTYEFLVRFPVNPGTLATDRAAFTPRQANDDPTDAALPLALRLTHRDTLKPLTPPRPAMRALEPLVDHRRRLVGANVRLTHRLTSTRKHSFPHALHWCDDKATTLFGDCLAHWPTLTAAQLARRATLARFFPAHHVRDAHGIDTRLQAITRATPLTTDAGVLAPHALLGQARVAQLRGILPASADCDPVMAPRAQRHPDFPVCAALPGAGAVCAPRLLVAFGAQRARDTSADALQTSAGIAPVTERRGNKPCVHGRWQCPTCLRHTCVAWAAASMRHAFWARTDSQPQRDQGPSPQAAVRALAFTWIRLLCRCGQDRTPYHASGSLHALQQRGSPLLHHVALGSAPAHRGADCMVQKARVQRMLLPGSR